MEIDSVFRCFTVPADSWQPFRKLRVIIADPVFNRGFTPHLCNILKRLTIDRVIVHWGDISIKMTKDIVHLEEILNGIPYKYSRVVTEFDPDEYVIIFCTSCLAFPLKWEENTRICVVVMDGKLSLNLPQAIHHHDYSTTSSHLEMFLSDRYQLTKLSGRWCHQWAICGRRVIAGYFPRLAPIAGSPHSNESILTDVVRHVGFENKLGLKERLFRSSASLIHRHRFLQLINIVAKHEPLIQLVSHILCRNLHILFNRGLNKVPNKESFNYCELSFFNQSQLRVNHDTLCWVIYTDTKQVKRISTHLLQHINTHNSIIIPTATEKSMWKTIQRKVPENDVADTMQVLIGILHHKWFVDYPHLSSCYYDLLIYTSKYGYGNTQRGVASSIAKYLLSSNPDDLINATRHSIQYLYQRIKQLPSDVLIKMIFNILRFKHPAEIQSKLFRDHHHPDYLADYLLGDLGGFDHLGGLRSIATSIDEPNSIFSYFQIVDKRIHDYSSWIRYCYLNGWSLNGILLEIFGIPKRKMTGKVLVRILVDYFSRWTGSIKMTS